MRAARNVFYMASLLSRRILWLFEPRLLWFGACLITITFGVLVWVHPRQELFIRCWSMMLQIIGTWTVISELRSTQKSYEIAGWRHWMQEWHKRWPSGKVINLGAGTAEMASCSASARATVRFSIDPAAAIEVRLDRLEKNLHLMEKDLAALYREVDAERRERELEIKAEADSRKSALSNLEEKLKMAAAGGLHLSMFGVGCFLLGMILGTIAPELAAIAKYVLLARHNA